MAGGAHTLVIVCLLVFFNIAQADEYGHCKLVGNQNSPITTGYVYFHSKNGTVTVYANVSGLADKPESLGMHIHEFGDLSSLVSASAGGHYKGNGNGTHGCPPGPRDTGDMGNWNATNGMIVMSKELDLIDLTGGRSIIGRAVVLHSSTDDCNSVASSGTRLAHCVIGVGNPGFSPAFLGVVSPNIAYNDGDIGSRATCELYGSGISGRVVFEQLEHGVSVTARVIGLPFNTTHGFHIHEFGDITNSDALGVHYNPYKYNHSLPENPARHFGDLGNLCTFSLDGIAYYNYVVDIITVTGSLNNIIGRGIVIHAIRDNGGTNYGARNATCVIGIANTQFTAPYAFDDECCSDPVCEQPVLVPHSYNPPTTTSTSGMPSAVTSIGTMSTLTTSSATTSRIASSSTSSFATSASPASHTPTSNKGAIIAVAILVPLFVVNLFVVAIWFYLRKKKQRQQDDRYQPFLDE